MPANSFFNILVMGLAWLALVLIAVYLVGLLIPSRRQFCANSLSIGAVSSLLLTTVYLFVALFFGFTVDGMLTEAVIGVTGACFSIGALGYALAQLRKRSQK
jgi:hypothetical protein